MTMFLAMLALAAAPQAAPASAPVATAPADAEASLERVLAVVLPAERILGDALGAFEREFGKGFMTEQGKQIEAAHPGLLRDVMADMRLQVEPLFRDGLLKDMRAAAAGYYRETFTAAELADLAAFYATPTGRRLVTAGQDAAKSAAESMPRAATTPEQLPSSLGNVVNQGMAGAMKQVRADDMPVLLEFSRTSASRKANATLPDMQKQMTDTLVAFMRRSEPQIAAIAAASFQRQMAKRTPTERR